MPSTLEANGILPEESLIATTPSIAANCDSVSVVKEIAVLGGLL